MSSGICPFIHWGVEGESHDFISAIVGNHARTRRDAIRADLQERRQPRAAHPVEAQRKRQYPHDRNVLQNPELPRGRHNGIHPGQNMSAPLHYGNGALAFCKGKATPGNTTGSGNRPHTSTPWGKAFGGRIATSLRSSQ